VNKLSIIDQGSGLFIVDGDLTFASIDKKTVKSFEFLKTAKQVTIDLERVSSTDSAGLALMIEWIKVARQHDGQLSFKNIPEQLRNLAKLSGFEISDYFATTNLPGF
jgi:phospholipid transport system transporter-binding protein